MANAEEDFSFPATTSNPPPCFFESPPLWRPVLPIAALGSFEVEEEVEYYEEKFNSCSSQELKTSKVNQGKSSSCDCYDSDKEDKMDMLWEGLNDEFSETCAETPENPDRRMNDEFPRSCGEKRVNSDNSSSPEREVQVCCVKALKLSKQNSETLCGKKASVLVLVRVLKNGLAMHHSRTSVKKRAW